MVFGNNLCCEIYQENAMYLQKLFENVKLNYINLRRGKKICIVLM